MKKLLLFAGILLFTACGRFGNKEKKQNTDQRIVCLSEQHNEIIYALGAQKNLVAVDVSSIYPAAIQKLPTVGYHMALSLEGILSMKPTLIIEKGGAFSIGPEQVVRQLKQLKIPFKTFKNRSTDIPSTVALIREMGAYFHRKKKADSLCDKLTNDMQLALSRAKDYNKTPSVAVIHFDRASSIYLLVTDNSTAAKMVKWAGGEMAIHGDRSMIRLASPEIIAKANPDVILMTDYGYDRLGSDNMIDQLPGVGETRAAKNHQIYRVEEHDLLYLGPRTGENVLKLQRLIHQDATAQEGI